MFFDMATLRKGGRFYLAHIASTWPSKFARVPNKQILDCNLLELSDELREIINRGSHLPSAKYSLRLSSTLLLGLMKIYQRKTNLLYLKCLAFYGETSQQKKAVKRTRVVIQEVPEEIQENQEITIRNVSEITLNNEVTIPAIVIDDNFGEIPNIEENINTFHLHSVSVNLENPTIAEQLIEEAPNNNEMAEMPVNIKFTNSEQHEDILSPNIQAQIPKNKNKRNRVESDSIVSVPTEGTSKNKKRETVQKKWKIDLRDGVRGSDPLMIHDTLVEDFKPSKKIFDVDSCFNTYSSLCPHTDFNGICSDELKLLYLKHTALNNYPSITLPIKNIVNEFQVARAANNASPSHRNVVELTTENVTQLPSINEKAIPNIVSLSKTVDNQEHTSIPDLPNDSYLVIIPVEKDVTEEQLGLNQTSVSLRDADPLNVEEKKEVDKLLSDNWGPSGLIEKISKAEIQGEKNINLEKIVELGYQPTLNITPRMAAVRAFASLLALKKNNIVEVVKKENSCEIQHISLKKHSQNE